MPDSERTQLCATRSNRNRARALRQRTLRQARRNSWRRYVSSISSMTPTAKIRGCYADHHTPTLNLHGSLENDSLAVSNAFADHFRAVSSVSRYDKAFQSYKSKEESHSLNFTTKSNLPYNALFSIYELQSALSLCRSTSPGLDEIHFDMIRHLHPHSTLFLLDLYNLIWVKGFYPSSWRIGIILSFVKPGRDGLNADYISPKLVPRN